MRPLLHNLSSCDQNWTNKDLGKVLAHNRFNGHDPAKVPKFKYRHDSALSIRNFAVNQAQLIISHTCQLTNNQKMCCLFRWEHEISYPSLKYSCGSITPFSSFLFDQKLFNPTQVNQFLGFPLLLHLPIVIASLHLILEA
jgi:hypothetical protein